MRSSAKSNRILHNVFALYGVQIGRKVIPLLSVPYLARVLGPVGWGTVAFAAALAEFVVILIEFGFNISATRETARKRDDTSALSDIVAGVLGAQIVLAACGIAAAVTVARCVPLMRQHPDLLMAGLMYAVAQGFAPLWFFQGLERIRLSAALEVSGKLLALGGLFLFVHQPEDGWKVLALSGIAPLLTTVAGFWLAYRVVPLQAPSLRVIVPALKMGWPMFLFRSAESLYGVGNAFLLGLFTTPELVGYFASAEKIAKATFGLLNPIREAIFPRLSHLVAMHGSKAAVPLARRGALVMIGAGAWLGLALFVFAPFAIRLLLGSAFAPAVTVLRIFAALPLLLSITYSVGFQWLLPLGQDRTINQIILAAGVLNLALSFGLASRYAHVGMAVAVMCAEAFVSIAMVVAVLRVNSASASSSVSTAASIENRQAEAPST